MSSKLVALTEEIEHEESSAKLAADTLQTGSWTFVSLTITSTTKTKVDSKTIAKSAIAVWSYTGGLTAPNTPLPPVPDTATLNGTTTGLKEDSISFIRDGDSASGSVDSANKIVTNVSQNKLKSI